MKIRCLILLVALAATACYEDHSDLIPGQDFIPDEILAKIKENGQPIYEGLTPPDVTGKYRISPLILQSSNFDDVAPGRSFSDEIVAFTDYDPGTLTLKVNSEQANTTGEGFGSFIAGEDNNFTIYVRIDRVDENGHKTLSTDVYSGTLSSNGITDLYRSAFMVDDGGDPDDDLIENGEGRLFRDDDGFSEKL